MKKIIVGAFLGAALFVGVGAVLKALASPEQKIRWRLEGMAEDFNAGRAGPCCRGLTNDFRDVTSGADAQDIRAILSRISLSERHPETKELLYRVTLPPEELQITVDPADGTSALVDLVAVFEKMRGGEWGLYWRVVIAAEMTEGEDGWQVRRSTHETLEGQRFR